jgi:prepilin-type N-terminal cleavage/methylation domain-containing protein
LLDGPLVETLGQCTGRTIRVSRAYPRPRRLPRLRLRRAALRSASGGFTLIELMVVVILISILAVLAAPALRTARDDRAAFDYARQIQQLVSRARTRAAARGAAHLVIAAPSGTRGKVQLWEALDGTIAPLGPNPVSSCKGTTQWAPVDGYVPGSTPSNVARIVQGIDLDSAGINVDADIKAEFYISDVADPTNLKPVKRSAFALCVTPNGTVFAAEGSDIPSALDGMRAQPPFAGIAEVHVTRNSGGAPVGLSRNVTIAGAAAARIHSL